MSPPPNLLRRSRLAAALVVVFAAAFPAAAFSLSWRAANYRTFRPTGEAFGTQNPSAVTGNSAFDTAAGNVKKTQEHIKELTEELSKAVASTKKSEQQTSGGSEDSSNSATDLQDALLNQIAAQVTALHQQSQDIGAAVGAESDRLKDLRQGLITKQPTSNNGKKRNNRRAEETERSNGCCCW